MELIKWFCLTEAAASLCCGLTCSRHLSPVESETHDEFLLMINNRVVCSSSHDGGCEGCLSCCFNFKLTFQGYFNIIVS